MLFRLYIIFCVTPQYAMANTLNGQWYERQSTSNLYCREFNQRAGMSAVSCAVNAAAETVYNFGFVVQGETCMVCRASDLPRNVNNGEVSFTRIAQINGRKWWIERGVYKNIHVNSHCIYIYIYIYINTLCQFKVKRIFNILIFDWKHDM